MIDNYLSCGRCINPGNAIVSAVFLFFFFLWLPTPFIGGVICKICQWVENQTIIIHLLTNKTRHRHFKNLSPTEKLQQFYRYIMTNICQICQKFQIQVHANSNECQSTIPGFLISKKCFHRFKLSFFFQEDQTMQRQSFFLLIE